MSIGNKVTMIGNGAFYNLAGLSGNLIIPNSVTTIGGSAFKGCTTLNKIEIPNTVSTIDGNAFKDVAHIYYHGTATGSPWGALAYN